MEELGIEANVGELFEEVVHTYKEKTVHLKFFRCQCPTQEPRPIACQAVAWVTREQLGEYEFPAADFRLIGKLKAEAGLWHSENV